MLEKEEALGGGAARERERQRSPVSFSDTHKLPGSPCIARVVGRSSGPQEPALYRVQQWGAEKKAENLEKRHFPPQHGHAGWVGFIGLLRSALLPARQRSRTQRVVRTSRNGGRGRALDWVASIGPSLSRSFYPFTSRNLLSRKGPCRFWRRSQRTPAPECRILCLRGKQPRRMLSSILKRELQRGIGPRVGVPRHTGRRPLLGTNSSKQNKARNLWCQRPREQGCHQVAGRAGARAITSFPHSTEPSPDPVRTTKDSLRFPTVSVQPLLPPQNPNLVLGENSALLPNLF